MNAFTFFFFNLSDHPMFSLLFSFLSFKYFPVRSHSSTKSSYSLSSVQRIHQTFSSPLPLVLKLHFFSHLSVLTPSLKRSTLNIGHLCDSLIYIMSREVGFKETEVFPSYLPLQLRE